jgi:hypothetical protein
LLDASEERLDRFLSEAAVPANLDEAQIAAAGQLVNVRLRDVESSRDVGRVQERGCLLAAGGWPIASAEELD